MSRRRTGTLVVALSAIAAFSLITLIIMMSAEPSMALAGRYPNDQKLDAEEWPRGIAKSLNAVNRVYGWVDAELGHRFYVESGPQELARCLETFRAVEQAELRLVFAHGRGETIDGFRGKLEIPYDWQVEIQDLSELPQGRAQNNQAAQEEAVEWRITVYVRLSERIPVSSLKIPLEYEASVGGELVDLLREHRKRREEIEQGAWRKSDPTTVEDTPRGGLFDAGDDPPEADDSKGGPSDAD